MLELGQARGQANVVQMLLRWTVQEQDARAEPRQVAWQRLAHTSWAALVASECWMGERKPWMRAPL